MLNTSATARKREFRPVLPCCGESTVAAVDRNQLRHQFGNANVGALGQPLKFHVDAAPEFVYLDPPAVSDLDSEHSESHPELTDDPYHQPPAAGCQTYPGPVGDLIIDPCARRDANGFAVDGPALPDAPSEQSSAADCRAYRDQLRAWSNYQNAHRPPGATAGLPMSSQVQNLYLVCNLGYFDS